MWIFISSIITVSIIAKCFFKKKFWENRYLVLLLIGGVAFIATITTNYATRGSLGTKVETVWTVPLQVMNLNDTLVDSTNFTVDEELSRDDHLHGGDTLLQDHYSRHFFYYGDDGLRVGFASDDDMKSRDWDYVYFAESENDTTAYFTKMRIKYDNNSKWVANFSLPTIDVVRCFYLPPSEYAAIPDSLIRELPL